MKLAPRQINPKQAEFVRQYLVDLNATRAAIRAGYSARTAESQGARLLRNAKVSVAIQAAIEARATKTEVTAERVVRELASIAFLDPIDLFEDDGSLRLIHNMPESARRAVAGIEVTEIFDGAEGEQKQAIGLLKKIRIVPKVDALNMLCKHLGMFELGDGRMGDAEQANKALSNIAAAMREQVAKL